MAITHWFDSGKVNHQLYPEAFKQAIITQSNIGWQHVFMGHISQEWERIQGPAKMKKGKQEENQFGGLSCGGLSPVVYGPMGGKESGCSWTYNQ